MVIGYENVSFTNSTGEDIELYKVNFAFPRSDKETLTGFEVESYFLTLDKFRALEVPKLYEHKTPCHPFSYFDNNSKKRKLINIVID